MPRRTVAELQAEKAELNAVLAAATAELTHARKKQKTEAMAWGLDERTRRVVVTAAMLAFPSTEPAEKFLAAKGRERKWPELTEEDLKKKVNDTFLAASAEEAGALACEGDPLDAHALRTATKHVHEWRVAEWVRRVNIDTGVAPSTQSVLEKAEALRLTIPDSCRPPSAGTSAESRGREWARRLRLRYGGRMGATPVGERLPPDELRAKDLFQDGFSTIRDTALPLPSAVWPWSHAHLLTVAIGVRFLLTFGVGGQ